jgi:hypothetical protein
MKNRIITSLAVLLLASLSAAQAQTTIVKWTFDNDPVAAPTFNPGTSTDNSAGAVSAASIGMDGWLTPAAGTNDPDVLVGKSSDTGANGIANTSHEWRVRAQNATSPSTANGWSSQAPIGSQGAQFNVDTTGYSSINVAFDWYLTTQGEANGQLQYTTDFGGTWNNIQVTIPASGDAGLAAVNNTGSDTLSVTGWYLSDNVLNNGPMAGQDWFTNLTATITDPAAANNPQFGIRFVNASTGGSCVSSQGTALNNNSGNWRFDNIIVTGTPSSAFAAPTLIAAGSATVDAPFTVTFTDSPAWRGAITSIKVNGTTLAPSAYTISAGHITFTPSASSPATLLQTAGLANISVFATSYNVAQVNQYIGPGAAINLSITAQPVSTVQPLVPTGNGGTLITQPALAVVDQYGNSATNCSATFTATTSTGWSFGASSGIAQLLTNGTVIYTNLSVSNSTASIIPNATITFTASVATGLGGLPTTVTNSAAFAIAAPTTSGFTPGNLAVLQLDGSANNTTFSIIELSGSVFNSAPVNIFPIPSTGTNAMRMSGSSSTGRLSDSEDGTLICFDGFINDDSTVSDETDILTRGAGTLDATGTNYILQATYMSTDSDPVFGNTQARSATTLDDKTFYMGDKYGVYTNTNSVIVSGTGGNVRPLRAFGGQVYALTQSGSSQPTILLMNYVNGDSLYPLNGFPVEPLASDFYMVSSGVNGTTNDILYYIDPTNKTSGAIFKFCLSYDPLNADRNGQLGWVPAGSTQTLIQGGVLNSAPTPNGGDGLYAVRNGGGVDLYYTTGTGGTTSNSLVKVHDSAGYNQGINLGAFQTLYVAPPQAILKGVALAPSIPQLAIGSVSVTGSGVSAAATLAFNYIASSSISVHASSSLTAPVSTWPVIGPAVEGPPGYYTFTDPNPANSGARYYLLSKP